MKIEPVQSFRQKRRKLTQSASSDILPLLNIGSPCLHTCFADSFTRSYKEVNDCRWMSFLPGK